MPIALFLLALFTQDPAPADPPREERTRAFVATMNAEGSTWRDWFAAGMALADAPPADGAAVAAAAWPKIESPQARQQLLKAWVFDLPAPFRSRFHPETLNVLELGLRDADEGVRAWARGFCQRFAFRAFESDEAALLWIGGEQDKPLVDVWTRGFERWLDSVRGAEGEALVGHVEAMREFSHPFRRNPDIAAIAKKLKFEEVAAPLLRDERLSSGAVSGLYAWLHDVDPQRYPDEKRDEVIQAARQREEAREEAERQAAAARLDKRTIDGDDRRTWILHRPAKAAPEKGAALVVVLPGGSGSADFAPFVGGTLAAALGDDAVVAQIVAPPIAADDKDAIVWPTKRLADDRVDFTMEPIVAEVLKAVRAELRIDPQRIYALGWSSGGPLAYALVLEPDSPFAGAFVVMSVFKPQSLPPLDGAKGKRFYILHSPQDFIPMRFPEDAADALRTHGAAVKLERYEGGHGWHGDVAAQLRAGMRFLEARD